MTEPQQTPIEVRKFFNKTIPDQMHLTAIDPNKIRPTIGKDFGTDAEAASRWALERNTEGCNVYFTVNLVRDGVNSKPSKADIEGIRFGHVDIDPPKGVASFTPLEREAAFERLKAAEPSIIIWSGNGWQGFWRVDGGVSIDKVEHINRGLIQALGGDKGTHDASRLLRVPGLTNWPNEGKRCIGRVPVLSRIVIEDLGTVSDVQTLLDRYPAPPLPDKAKAQPRDAIALRDVELMTADDLGLPEDAYLRSLIDAPKSKDRSADTFHFACEALRKGLTPQHIMGVLLNSDNAISAHCLSEADPERAARRAVEAAQDALLSSSTPLRPIEQLIEDAARLSQDDLADIERLAMEASMHGPLRAERVHRAIKKATGTSLGALRSFSQGGHDKELDHLRLARLTLDQLGRDNILCDENAIWYWKPEGVWKAQDDRAVKHAVQAQIDCGGGNVVASMVNGVLDVLKTEIFKPEHLFNLGRPETVNCLNGELELIDGLWSLQQHRRENYRTTQIPVLYDPTACAPRFEQFLGQVFRDDNDGEAKRQALLEMMGYSLMSHARHEKFALLIGPGSNGKSVVLKLLEGLLGSANVAGVQPSNFNNIFQRGHLDQKLANIVTELKQGEVIADAELKAITSGETATAEHKNKDPFTMRPFCTCWFGTNHMPHSRDFSDALLRRAVIFEFNRTFSESERDPNLTDKLLEELPGVLNLALKAYAGALKCGFTKFSSCDAAKKAWALEADQVAQFIDECGVRAPEKVSIGTVFSEYGHWARDNGVGKTVSKRTLRSRLTRLGFGEARDNKGRYVTGLKLRGVLGFTISDASDANSQSRGD
jgi:putative DNA primase/helicase